MSNIRGAIQKDTKFYCTNKKDAVINILLEVTADQVPANTFPVGIAKVES